MLSCGITRLYELLNEGELTSYLDGRSRLITTESIRAYVERKVAASETAAPRAA
jgi:excisionase family DNA binding protein